MPNPTKRAAQVKARRMWLDAYGVPRSTEQAALSASLIKNATPVFQLPADPASLERMREQVAKAMFLAINPGEEWFPCEGYTAYWRTQADTVLSSLGLTTGGRKG